MNKPEQRTKRGYLPHFDAAGFTQFITFRLAGSLPRTFVEDLSFKLKNRIISDAEYRRQIELYLGDPRGPTHLKNEKIADTLAETIQRFDGVKYDLYAWVIMPNHVHLLLTPIQPYTISQIVHSLKSFTANLANKELGLNGRFWAPDYFDRFIRGRRHFENCVTYIEENPVKAGLCRTADEWKWGSAGGGDER